MSKQTELAQVADTITVDSGNVGIGTSSPSQQLHLSGSTPIIRLTDTDTNAYGEISSSSSDGNLMFFADQGNTQANTTIRFYVDATERMRIDSSGNLLVSATTTSGFQSSSSESGTIAYAAGGIASNSPSNDVAGVFNRLGTDGIIVQLKKDGSTVGSIGYNSYGFEINGEANHTGWSFANNTYIPLDNGARVDNNNDLGSATYRFDDLYASNTSIIGTSDKREKQDIAELDETEQRVAVACKGLMRKFRWKDAVAKKGDDARIHFGIIAQELQDAFAAEGLDAGRYGMFIHNTWWEHDVEVPAVEAVAEALDEEGNVVTEAVEAKDAYTRTDTYETQEEAPEGSVNVTAWVCV